MESIFDGHLGCARVLAADACRMREWGNNLMIHFEASHYKAGQKYLDKVLKDPRLPNLKGISLKYEKKPTLRQIVSSADNMPNLQYAFFSGPRNWNHFDFLNAYPGISRMYAKGITWPFDPIRHIGLQYLGIAPERWGIRNLHALSKCVFPDLQILSFDLSNTTPVESVPILADICAGIYFPRIRRVHLQNCRFTNKLISALADIAKINQLQITELDLMNSPVNNQSAKHLSEFLPNTNLSIKTNFHRIGKRNLNLLHEKAPQRFTDNLEILPY